MGANTIVIGIDPGKDGYAVAIDDNRVCLGTCGFDELGYIHLFASLSAKYDSNIIAVLENVHAYPKWGCASTFRFGENYGFIRGVLMSFGIQCFTVSPKRWKKEFDLDSDKSKSIKCATELFPSVDLRRTQKCTILHDGKAEALLIAEYGLRRLLRGEPIQHEKKGKKKVKAHRRKV